MQYNIRINQKAIVDAKLDLDFEDAAIIDFIYSFSHSSAIDKMVSHNKEYYWFAYKKVLAELPLLKISKDRVYRKFKNMAELGLLEAHPDNKTLGRSYYAITQKMVALYHGNDSPPSVKTTDPYGENDVPPTVKTTYNQDTIYQDTKSYNTLSVESEEKNSPDNFFEKEIPNTVDLGDVEARLEQFQQAVYFAGDAIYTRQMLDDFIDTWGQYDETARKPKMRWEKEKSKKGWVVKKRLKQWAQNNYNKIQCFLSADCQKTISDKKDDFKAKLAPFLPRYGKDFLNYFFRIWSQPENKPDPKSLKWENETFWGLADRLAQAYETWLKRNQNQR